MYKVLVVDDEPLIREGLTKLIDWDELGVEIMGEASNGFEALEFIHREHPQILICDVRMPGMDGLELLKRLRDENCRLKVVILSGYNHFEYVKEAMKYRVENYLLKPVNKDELTSTMLNIIDTIQQDLYSKIQMRENYNILKNNILNRMIANNITQVELKDKLKFLELNLSSGQYSVAVIQMLDSGTQIPPQDFGRKAYSIFNIVEENINQEQEGICFQDIPGNSVIIFNNPVNKASKIDEFLEKCMENINRFLQLDVLAAVGKAVGSFEQVHLSYNDAVKLMDYKYITMKNRIVYYDEERNNIQNSLNLIKYDINLFGNYLVAGRKEDVSEFLDSLYNHFKEKGVKPFHIQSICNELILCSISIVKKLRIGVEKILPDKDVLDNVLKYETAKELIDWLKTFCENIILHINIKKQKPKNLIDEIITYVNENYTDEISLKHLSALFFVTPAYLGQLFKNEANMIFTDYLNKIRVEKAKEILSNTHKKASEVSKMVGYNDSNYFYKIFRRYTGLYPSEFRIRDSKL